MLCCRPSGAASSRSTAAASSRHVTAAVLPGFRPASSSSLTAGSSAGWRYGPRSLLRNAATAADCGGRGNDGPVPHTGGGGSNRSPRPWSLGPEALAAIQYANMVVIRSRPAGGPFRITNGCLNSSTPVLIPGASSEVLLGPALAVHGGPVEARVGVYKVSSPGQPLGDMLATLAVKLPVRHTAAILQLMAPFPAIVRAEGATAVQLYITELGLPGRDDDGPIATAFTAQLLWGDSGTPANTAAATSAAPTPASTSPPREQPVPGAGAEAAAEGRDRPWRQETPEQQQQQRRRGRMGSSQLPPAPQVAASSVCPPVPAPWPERPEQLEGAIRELAEAVRELARRTEEGTQEVQDETRVRRDEQVAVQAGLLVDMLASLAKDSLRRR